MARKHFDIAIIGSGPAGIRAAVQAAKLGKKVVVIEKNPVQIGGAWLHTGTLPSKTLREILANIHSIKSHVGQDWVDRISQDLSMNLLLQRARMVSKGEEILVQGYLKNNAIETIHGTAWIEDQKTIRINFHDHSDLIYADHILLATGSRPRRPENLAFDGWRIVDSDDVLQLSAMPKKMIIYGAGVIGCEYACIFQVMGCQVTLVDSRSQVMEFLDRQMVGELIKAMQSIGVHFVLGEDLSGVSVQGPQVEAQFTSGAKLATDVLFFAAGRIPNSQKLGLEQIGVGMTNRGHVIVNEDFQTAVPSIYAVGDVIGPPALAATASEQGRHATCHMFGVTTKAFPSIYPIGVYTIPELSSVGKSEEQLIAEKVDYVTGIALYEEIARGNLRGDSHGLLKLLVCRETQAILGIHIVGEGACNLVHIGMAFMLTGGVVQDLVSMIFNYPTLAEGYRIAAFNALNKIFADGSIHEKAAQKTRRSA